MKTLGNIKRKYRTFLHRRSRAGFTLLELLVSIAITGILTAMMFSNFSKEKDRNAIKATVHQLQTDLQAMQTNAQSGIVGDNGLVPGGYGVNLTNTTSYILFADVDAGDEKYLDGTDIALKTGNVVANAGVTISKISPNTATNIIFSAPNGTAKITDSAGVAVTGPVIIYLKSAKLNVCYAITVTAGVGTISQRLLRNFSDCG